ncbi:MAG: T9SS type A sorting domain-containing protein [Bacteroidetes bacterium]|nr:T9SS type A sorting domain-containing protein [Bacteroidota bacterium]
MKNFTPLKLLVLSCFISLSAFCVPKLNSYPSVTPTIYLDFDGQSVIGTSWNSGNPIFCAPSGLDDTQITEIFNRVAEDYRPFAVNITTDSTKFLAAPLNRRIRIIVTPTSGWTNGVGGISYIGSFTWGDDTPGFVFCDRLGPNNPKYVAECCSHESGHAVGLSHQSTYDSNCTLTETYCMGAGTGEVSWAPIMGNSYYRNMTSWNDGPTPYGCANTQDNLTIITSMNGFTYRTDDFTEVMDGTTYTLNNSFNIDGIITTNSDKDVFRYVVPQSVNFHLEAIPGNVGSNYIGANLDIKISLYNGSTLIRTYDPPTTMKVTIDTTLSAGTYYIMIDGTGNMNASNYGSLGSYTLTGFNGPLPIHAITLTGTSDNGKHALSWNVIADEPIKEQIAEVSTDGIIFKPLYTLNSTTKAFSYTPYNSGVLYYRIRVTSVIDQTAYSNIVALKVSGKPEKAFTVSNFAQHDITVSAFDDYQYRLTDANGRTLATGKGTKGLNRINVDGKPNGFYVLQLFSNNEQQTERIIKQ